MLREAPLSWWGPAVPGAMGRTGHPDRWRLGEGLLIRDPLPASFPLLVPLRSLLTPGTQHPAHVSVPLPPCPQPAEAKSHLEVP